MSTELGTVASPVSLLDSDTTRSPEVEPDRVTVPVAVPPFSEIEDGLTLMPSVGVGAV